MGQVPGPSLTISGCIGHTHWVAALGVGAVAGSNAIPHLGHEPGPACLTSGCMGQV